MYINWEDSTLRFDPVSPDPFVAHGIPLPVYGNYGGPNWSAGEVGGTITANSPPPKDQLDADFYAHDLTYQSSTDPLVRAGADMLLVQQMHDLTYTDPASQTTIRRPVCMKGLPRWPSSSNLQPAVRRRYPTRTT